MAGLVGPVEICGEVLRTFQKPWKDHLLLEVPAMLWKHQSEGGKLLDLQIVWIAIYVVGGLIAYAVIFFGGVVITEYIWGHRMSDTYGNTVGIPIILVLLVMEAVVSFVTWPIRIHNQRLFIEYFGFYPNSTWRSEYQATINIKLSKLASDAQYAFDDEEKARHNEKTNLGFYKREVKYRKGRFWEAYNLAEHFSYEVRGDKIDDFLVEVAPSA